MYRNRILAGAAATALIVAAPAALTSNGAGLNPIPPAHAQTQIRIGFDVFYDRLSDHGQWVRYDPYGFVWVPTVVAADWAPYTVGRWIYTRDFGWYFASDEPFAWAAYHYGRWGYEPDVGWFWVPGTTWAPAWVAWRSGPDHVGWAPLPPQGDGASVSVSINIGSRDVPRAYWIFVPVRQFVVPSLQTVVVRGYREPDIFQRTEFLGPVHVEGDLVINNIVEVNYIEQHTGEEIVVHNVQVVDDPDAAVTAQAEGESIPVFQAQVAEAPQAEPPQVVEREEVTAEAPTAGQVDEAELQAAEEEPEGEGLAGEQPAEPAPDVAGEEPAEPAPDVAEEQPAEPAPDVAGEEPAEPAPDVAEEQPAEPAPDVAGEEPAEPAPDVAEEQPAEPAPDLAEEQPAEPAPDVAEEQPAEPAPDVAEEQPAEPAPDVAEEQPAEPAPDVAEEQPAEPAPDVAEQPEGTVGETSETPALEAPAEPQPEPEPEAGAPPPQEETEAAPEQQPEELLPQQQ